MQSHQPKKGILALTDYPGNLREADHQQLHRQCIRFDEIMWITTIDVKTNFVLVVTNQSRQGLLGMSMRGILDELPPYFVRISSAYIINILHRDFEGLINSSIIVIGGQRFEITDTYRENVREILKEYYIM